MISEKRQEQASFYALGALPATEQDAFETALHTDQELQELLHSLQNTSDLLAMSVPPVSPPAGLRNKILQRITATESGSNSRSVPAAAILSGLRFTDANELAGWKQLPIPGASLKLMSLNRERGYAVLLGRLAPGTRYPAHDNAGPEEFVILSGDLHIGERELGPGDFHHADADSHHEENYSVEGCTVVAVLTSDNPLVAFAMS